jgi:LytR cell envelope-related transcriptional attenuator
MRPALMHFIESIGPVLGIVAFVGLATLAFLLFQQARDLRRLREWAGRAPERAQEAAEAVQAAAEASRGEAEAGEAAGEAEAGEAAGEAEAGEAEAPPPGRPGAAWSRLTGAVTPRLVQFERRLPVDGRYILAVVVIAVVVAGALTSGFGVLGGDDGKRDKHRGSSPKPTVAVLNGTGVPGLAALVDEQVVKTAGYRTGTIDNAGSSFANTVAMFAPGHEADAKRLATAIESKLGDTPTQAMTTDVRDRAGGAPLALGLGLDDSRFGSG